MKSKDKIKLQSEAATLFKKLSGNISAFKKLPLIEKLTFVIAELTATIIAYVRPLFERAKTAKEFEDKVSGNLVGKCELVKGVNVEAANDAGQAITDVSSRFDMGQLKFFGSPSKAPQKASIRGRVIAHYCGAITPLQKRLHPNVDQINISTNMFARYTQQEKEQLFNYSKQPEMVAAFKRNAQAWLSRTPVKDEHSNELKAIVDDRSDAPFTLNYTFEPDGDFEMTMGSMYHELGHRFHAWLGREEIDSDFLSEIERSHKAGWGFALSAYATKNEREYFAEAFCAYMMGSFDKRYYAMLHPTILTYLRKYDKKDISQELAA